MSDVNLMADFRSLRSQLIADRIAGADYSYLAHKYGISLRMARHTCYRAIKQGLATAEQLRVKPDRVKRPSDAEYNQAWIARVKAKTVESERGCWLWTGFINEWGYGKYSYRGQDSTVHRRMYKVVHGVTLNRNQYVCHSCDTPHCCNPDHLWLGTNSDNQKDASRKGRHSEGKKTHCPQNHEYTPENTLLVKSASGGKARQCKTCVRERHRRTAQNRGVQHEQC